MSARDAQAANAGWARTTCGIKNCLVSMRDASGSDVAIIAAYVRACVRACVRPCVRARVLACVRARGCARACAGVSGWKVLPMSRLARQRWEA
jgi:hypothetical protein